MIEPPGFSTIELLLARQVRWLRMTTVERRAECLKIDRPRKTRATTTMSHPRPELNIGCLSGCGKAANRRGLCNACCRRQDVAIRSGQVTEAQLIAQGLRKPA